MGNVVIGDEAAFFMNGKVISHNLRCYAPKGHPPLFHFDMNICKEKLSLWIGLCGNGRLVGHFFYDNTQNGLKYLDMIIDEIIPELRRIYGDQFGRIWWFEDGASAHRPLIVRERLHELFGDHIVALNHEI